jgi:hypothetical protein
MVNVERDGQSSAGRLSTGSPNKDWRDVNHKEATFAQHFVASYKNSPERVQILLIIEVFGVLGFSIVIGRRSEYELDRVCGKVRQDFRSVS